MTIEKTAIPRSRRNPELDRLIGKRLRDIRLSGGVSQEELAERLGIERVSLSRYETGQRALPFSVLLTISDVLHRPVGDFTPSASQPIQRAALLSAAPLPPGTPAIEEIAATLTQHPQLAASVQQFLAAMLYDEPDDDA